MTSTTYPDQRFLFAVRDLPNDRPVACLAVIGESARRAYVSDDDLYERLGVQETHDGVTLATKPPGFWIWEGVYEFYPGSNAGGIVQDADDQWSGELRPATAEDLVAFGMGVAVSSLRSTLERNLDAAHANAIEAGNTARSWQLEAERLRTRMGVLQSVADALLVLTRCGPADGCVTEHEEWEEEYRAGQRYKAASDALAEFDRAGGIHV